MTTTTTTTNTISSVDAAQILNSVTTALSGLGINLGSKNNDDDDDNNKNKRKSNIPITNFSDIYQNQLPFGIPVHMQKDFIDSLTLMIQKAYPIAYTMPNVSTIPYSIDCPPLDFSFKQKRNKYPFNIFKYIKYNPFDKLRYCITTIPTNEKIMNKRVRTTMVLYNSGEMKFDNDDREMTRATTKFLKVIQKASKCFNISCPSLQQLVNSDDFKEKDFSTKRNKMLTYNYWALHEEEYLANRLDDYIATMTPTAIDRLGVYVNQE
jgi:hypothetical protein